MPVFGLTQGLLPIMGYNYGAKNKKRLLSAFYNGCAIALVIMLAGTLLFLLAPQWLLGIFSASEELLEIGIPALLSCRKSGTRHHQLCRRCRILYHA